jgi:hypothetical protein
MEEVKAVHSDSSGGNFIGTGQWQYVGWKGERCWKGSIRGQFIQVELNHIYDINCGFTILVIVKHLRI